MLKSSAETPKRANSRSIASTDRRRRLRSLVRRVPIHPGFDAASTALEVVAGCDLGGRRSLVTGGASGIGREIAHAFAAAGAETVVADIDREQGEAAAAAIAAATGNGAVRFAALDLGSLAAVRDFAGAFRDRGGGLDILVNNAGVMACPLAYTVDGHERQFGRPPGVEPDLDTLEARIPRVCKIVASGRPWPALL